VPLDELWLEHLVKPFFDGVEVAAVYGRNIPRGDCNPYEARYIARAWRDRKEVKSMDMVRDLKELVFFSNTNSCIDKKIWEQFPFNEHLIQTEDQEWSMRVLRAGYKIAYEPSSVVIHSHNDPISIRFRRYYDAGTAHREIFGDNNRVYLPLIPFFAIGVTLLDMKFMGERGYSPASILKWAFLGVPFHLTEACGFWAGLHPAYFPKKLQAWMTLAGKYRLPG